MAFTRQNAGFMEMVYRKAGKEIIAQPPAGGQIASVYAVNDRGQILGTAYVSNCYRPFLWDKGTSTVFGTCQTQVRTMNNRGDIIGLDGQSGHGVVWQNGTAIDIGSVNPWGLNDAGLVVGATATQAFLWENGEFTYLTPLAGTTRCEARAINKHGEIAGFCSGGTTAAIVKWVKGVPAAMAMPAGIPVSINSDGVIVGRAGINGMAYAIVWTNNDSIILDQVLAETNWHFSTCIQINDEGMVSGWGNPLGTGGSRWFLANLSNLLQP